MVTHRDQVNPNQESRLSDEVNAKLDRLAELADTSPTVAKAIKDQLEALTLLEIGGLTHDELKKLEALTQARKAKPK
jgi:hypothetical protein